LRRFLSEDIRYLHRHLSARTKHFFRVNEPDENGAFVNMVRHHGYPTPLLDWTHSPYVAAFFAYYRIKKEDAASAGDKDVVRIHKFDQEQWKLDFTQFPLLELPSLHFSIIEFIAIENDRMVPQQAASTVTNIDDVEFYMKTVESTKKKNYLSAIDLPARLRNDVMRELSVMGITAGSMFPGLDGACEELAERNFDV
jgi:FRG domain